MSSLGAAVFTTRWWILTKVPAPVERSTPSLTGMEKANELPPEGGSTPMAVGGALRERDPLARAAALAAVLPQITGSNGLEVLDAWRAAQAKAREPGGLVDGDLLLVQVGRKAGRAALERDRPRDSTSPNIPSQFDLVMRGYAGSDAVGALNYWRGLPDGPYKNSLKSGLLTGLAENDARLAFEVLATLPAAEQVSHLPQLARQIHRQEGAEALQAWFDGLADDPLHPTVKWTSFHAVAEALRQDPAANADYMTREAAKRYAASDIYNQYAVAWTDEAPAAALHWAAGLPAPAGTTLRGDTMNTVVSRWTADDAGGVGDWLNANPQNAHYDEVAASYAQQLALLDPTAAARWINTIRNPDLRVTIADRLSGSVAVRP